MEKDLYVGRHAGAVDDSAWWPLVPYGPRHVKGRISADEVLLGFPWRVTCAACAWAARTCTSDQAIRVLDRHHGLCCVGADTILVADR